MDLLAGLHSRLMNVGQIQRQSIISLGSSVGLTIIGFFTTIYFARVLGPSILGAYFLLVAYFGVFNLIGDGGIGGAAVKRISEGREPNEYFSAFVVLRVLFLVFSISALIISHPYLVDLTDAGLYPWLIIAVIAAVLLSISNGGVYGRGKVGVTQFSAFLNGASKFIIQIIAVFFGYGLAGLAGGFVAGMIIASLMNLSFLNLDLVRFTWSHVTSLFLYSFWAFLSASGGLVFTYADTILIGYYLANADVGVYRVAFNLTGVAAFTTIALRMVLFPKISGWSAENAFRSIENALARAFTYSLLLAIPVAVGGWILSDVILSSLYGVAFARGSTALVILLIFQVVNVFMFLQTMSLNALDRPKDAFRVTAIASVINIVLDIVLIPFLGIEGAALATLVTIVVNSLLAYHALRKLIHVRMEWGSLRNIGVAVMGMALAVIVLRALFPVTAVFTLAWIVVVGGVIYFLLLLRLDKTIREDIQTILAQMGISVPGLS